MLKKPTGLGGLYKKNYQQSSPRKKNFLFLDFAGRCVTFQFIAKQEF